MFDPATAIAIVGAARTIIVTIVDQIAIAQAKGEVTPEQMAAVKQRAGLADAEWDQIVAEAKARQA